MNTFSALEIKFKKLNENAIIPSYAKPGDAGLDLTATSLERGIDEYDHAQITYGTGLAVEMPYGYVGLLFPRSSIYRKKMTLTNCVGVVDSGYRGELMFKFNINNNQGQGESFYKIGDRIGQLLILPYPTIIPYEGKDLSDTERGTSGYGSSGN
jgi:dUTP pyrophosphatase